MTIRATLDAIVEENYRRITAENERLRAEIAGLINITMTHEQVDAALSQMGQGGRV